MSSATGVLRNLKISNIGDNLRKLTDMFNESTLGSGLRPVYRITCSKDLDDGLVTDYVLVNTIPDWVKVRALGVDFPKARFGTEVLGKILEEKIGSVLDFQSPIEENAVIGMLIDESAKNIFRYLVDVIFTNVPYETVDGKRKWLGEDFLMLGFPVQITTGFIDVDGNFVRHQHEKPISTYGTIPPDFTGILGALTQETLPSGDFFQGTFVGFEAILAQQRLLTKFPLKAREPITRALARMLRWVATRGIKHNVYRTKERFEEVSTRSVRATAADATVPIPILRAWGVMEPNGTRILSVEEIRKKIIMQDMPRYGRVTQPHIEKKVSRRTIPHKDEVGGWNTYRDVLKVIQKSTNTVIYFNEYGRLVVQGRAKVREIAARQYDRIRVHDAIIGNNVIHYQGTIDLFQIVSRVIIHKVYDTISAKSPTRVAVYPTKPVGVMKERDQVSKHFAKYYAVNKADDQQTLFLYSYEDVDFEDDDSDVLEWMDDRFRYFGMRGSVFMIGNPKIRSGDVIRITDIRSSSLTGTTDKKFIAKLKKEIDFTIQNYQPEGEFKYDPLDTFKLNTTIEYYYVWKVVHYIGPDGYRTKVFYTKEQDSYAPGSMLLTQHIARRRRGQEGGI